MTTGAGNYRMEEANRYLFVSLLPALNDAQWGEIEECGKQVVERIKKSREPALLLNLSPMDYIGSSVVALIIRIWKAVDEGGGRMVVWNQSSVVEEVLNLAGLTRIWTMVASREQGEKALGATMPSAGGVLSGFLGALGLAALAAAGAGLYLLFNPIDRWEADQVLIMEFGCSVLAFAIGFALMIGGSGVMRGIAALLVVASLGIAVAGFALKFQ